MLPFNVNRKMPCLLLYLLNRCLRQQKNIANDRSTFSIEIGNAVGFQLDVGSVS